MADSVDDISAAGGSGLDVLDHDDSDMNARTFDLAATEAFAGVQLRKLLLNPISAAFYLFMLAPFAEEWLLQHRCMPIIVCAALIAFSLLVVHLFTRHKLLVNTHHKLLDEHNIAKLLSWNMIRHLSAYTNVDTLALLKAAVASERSLFILGLMGVDRASVLKHYTDGGETHVISECLQWGLDACKELKSSEVLNVGQSYTIKDLMRRSVVYSDNTAAQILFDYFPEEFLSKIMQALGISITRYDAL
jgi:hypothetical protein